MTKLLSVAIGACCVVSLTACSNENLNTIEGRVRAPGIPYEAVIFHRQADRLRTATINISIVQAGETPLNDIGNIYSASRESEAGAQKLLLNWRASDTLQIFRKPETHSYKENTNFDCMTGIFIQTTPFKIEYGDIKAINTNDSVPNPVPKRDKAVKTGKKKVN